MPRNRRLPLLADSLRKAPILKLKGYDYFVHPVTDGVPRVTKSMLQEVVIGLRKLLPKRFDRFLTPEAMGIPITSALTLATGKPFTVARKRSYGLPGEIAVKQRTGYSHAVLYVNDLQPGERIVIVDDVTSTGGTVRALVRAVRKAGARLEKVVLVINKGLDLDALAREVGAPVEALVRLRVEDGRVRLEA